MLRRKAPGTSRTAEEAFIKGQDKMKLPKVLEDLILDYYWSHRTFMQTQRLHRDLRYMHMIHEMRIFYSVFNTITVELAQTPLAENV